MAIGRHLHRAQPRAVARDAARRSWSRSYLDAGLGTSLSSAGCMKFRARGLPSLHLAAGHGRRHRKVPVSMRSGITGWRAAVEPGTPSISMRRCRRRLILAPIVEAIGEVGDLRLARGVLDHGRALGEARPPSAPCGCRRP